MKTSRSAITTFQACPRKRYLQYHHNITGIEPRKQAVPLVWGQGMHAGVAELLRGLNVDAAVDAALSAYAVQCSDRDFDLDELESQSFVYAEGKALIEGFIRAWSIARLPDFLGTYEVLEVEQEGLWSNWASTECSNCEGTGGEPELGDPCPVCDGLGGTRVDLAYRPDALLRKRNTGGLYVFNLKSSYAWGDREKKASRYNVQGLSEMAALENRLAEMSKKAHGIVPYKDFMDLPQWFLKLVDEKHSLKVDGIQDEIFIKGSRLNRKKDDPQKWQMTFLVHPWLKQGITTDDDQWAWQYYFERNGRNTSLGNSYSRVSVWEHMSMREWVEMLSSGSVQDSFPLSELFVSPIPHERNALELSEWLVQTQAQEQQIAQDLEGLTPLRLDTRFPMYRHSCFSYQRTCPYAEICHERLDPECGLYVPRVDHHAEIINTES